MPGSRPGTAALAPPRISTREEFIRALEAGGRNGEKLLAAYQDWRVARGYLGADPLTGVTAENAPSQVYAAMDRATQKSLADSGDLGAMQAYAAGSLSTDPVTAIEYYGRAAEQGSAAAMVEIAAVLASIEATNPGGPGTDPTFPQRLLALRGGDPGRDLRLDAAAWTLAAIRQHGPAVATPAGLTLAQELERSPDPAALTMACGKSLAILADLSAANAGRDTSALPPVFVAEQDLYGRLPCRDTPAPVMPPRALAGCSSSPAIGNASQPIELWICAEN
jgi:TPR repeat protein